MLTISVVLAALSWGVFLAWFSLRAKWWKSQIGRNTFGVSAVLFAVLLRIALVRVWPEFTDWTPLGVVIYLAAAAFAIQRIVFMERAQRGRKGEN